MIAGAHKTRSRRTCESQTRDEIREAVFIATFSLRVGCGNSRCLLGHSICSVTRYGIAVSSAGVTRPLPFPSRGNVIGSTKNEAGESTPASSVTPGSSTVGSRTRPSIPCTCCLSARVESRQRHARRTSSSSVIGSKNRLRHSHEADVPVHSPSHIEQIEAGSELPAFHERLSQRLIEEC